MTAKRILALWEKFWFTPGSPAPICLFRIFYGVLILACGLIWLSDLLTFFGPDGLVSISAVRQWHPEDRFSLLFLLPANNASVIGLFIVLMLAALCVTVGLFTRLSLIILFICLISFHHRNWAIMNSGDTILRIQGFILIFSPAASMFSLDYLRQKRKSVAINQWEFQTSIWTQRLLQLQIAAVYCQAFWSKIVSESWWNGTAVYYVSRLEDYRHFPVPFLFDNPFVCKLLTWGTLVIELSLWTLIWFKKLRYFVLIAGVLMHLGIDWALNIPLFSYAMIAMYVNFVPPQYLKRILSLQSTLARTNNGS